MSHTRRLAGAVCSAAMLLLLAMPTACGAEVLSLVPADSVAFAHIKLGEVWKSDLAAPFRSSYEKAGARAMAALEEQLDPPPSAFESFTFFLLMSDRGPLPCAIVTFNRKLDPAKVVKHYFPNAVSKALNGKPIHVNGNEAIHFVSDRQVIFSTVEGLAQYLSKPPEARGPMRSAIDLAASRAVVLSGHLAAIPLPPDALREVPPEIQPLLKVQNLTLSIDVQGEAKVQLAASYKDAAALAEAEKALEAAKKLAKRFTAQQRESIEAKLYGKKGTRPADEYVEVVGMVMGLGAMNRLDELIDNPGLRKEGTALALDFTIPKEIASLGAVYGPVAVGMLLPAVSKVREAAERTKSMNNLKQLALAIHNYYDANNKFPEDIKDKNGKSLLSWRVELLPYLEQQHVYQQFRRDEPWDSPANLKASQAMIPVFVSPNAPAAPVALGQPGLTHYVGVAGPDAVFEAGAKVKFQSIADGTSNTILLIETAAAVPWAKPGDFVFDPKKPLPNFLFPNRPTFGVAMCDGSVRLVNPKLVAEATIKAAITRSGGEVLGPDW